MSIVDVLKSLVLSRKRIDTKYLPSQGLFYPVDFSIEIKKADISDIIEYEKNYIKDNAYSIIECIKKVVKNNTILGNNYDYFDIKSVDIIFLFFEIVKYTQHKEIKIHYFDDTSGQVEYVEFNSDSFNYFDFRKFEKNYDEKSREILLDGYKLSLPSIGIEDSLTKYLISKIDHPKADNWNHYSYDFIYFLCNKNKMTFNEVDNLISIFNDDMDDSEQKKVKNITKKFINVIGYSINKDGKTIDIKTKVDLENIWKDS